MSLQWICVSSGMRVFQARAKAEHQQLVRGSAARQTAKVALLSMALLACTQPPSVAVAQPLPATAPAVQPGLTPSMPTEVVDTSLGVSVDFDKKRLSASRGNDAHAFDGCGGRKGLLEALGPPQVTIGPKDNSMMEAMNVEAWIYESGDIETEEGLVVLLTASSGSIEQIGIGTKVFKGTPKTRLEAERLWGPCSSKQAAFLDLPFEGWVACTKLRNVAFRTSVDVMPYKDADGVPRSDHRISMAMIKHARTFCGPKAPASKAQSGQTAAPR